MTTPQAISDLDAADPLDGSELMEATQDGGSVQTTAQAVAASPIAINSQAANYTLVLADAGRVVRVTAEATITVPPASSVAFPVGTVVNVRAATADPVDIAEGTSVTINTPETLVLDGQWAEVSLHYVGADVWDLVGAVEASP